MVILCSDLGRLLGAWLVIGGVWCPATMDVGRTLLIVQADPGIDPIHRDTNASTFSFCAKSQDVNWLS